jgi:hypothetical protein
MTTTVIRLAVCASWSVGKTRKDILTRQLAVGVRAFLLCPSLRQQTDDALDRDARPADHRFADHHVGGEYDARVFSRNMSPCFGYVSPDGGQTRSARLAVWGAAPRADVTYERQRHLWAQASSMRWASSACRRQPKRTGTRRQRNRCHLCAKGHVWAMSSKLMHAIAQTSAISRRQITYQNDVMYAIYAANEEKIRRDFNCFSIGDKHSAFVSPCLYCN